MAAKLLIIEADDPSSDQLITVTIKGPRNADRARVLKVLGHLFSTGEEWDGAPPNVRLVAEHVGRI